ncbi:MAG: hypothetical protein KIT02_07225 [Devosia sp.]|uniref:peptidase inhibitor family I36 protein n=1 Tax=Devosia sp. TaxID=1871048 RepID=UPI0024CAC169|nr:hypothetical protein [Devosia sp.]UYO00986.1 MAG: hypothetical protein KIT02_07225 [Devosia sp.]
MRFAAFVVLLASLFTALMAPAQADDAPGSHGWSRKTLELRSGPGPAYDRSGEIEGKVAIHILRCQELWCLVDGPGGRGWADRYHIGFGQTPAWPRTGPRLNYGAGGPGEVCFYTGTHFSGRALCAGPGEVFNDLALWGLDNVFSSVRITGDVSAAACRDRKFQSYCERIISDQPVLDQYLRRSLSSIRVY